METQTEQPEAIQAIAPGIYTREDYTNERYHSQKNATTKSKLDRIHRSAAHYKYAEENPEPPTEAMETGTAVHLAVLEPELFEAGYIAEITPADYPGALISKDQIANAIVDYNNGLPPFPSLEELQALILEHNARQPKPIKKGGNAELVAALTAAMNSDPKFSAGLSDMKAAELRAMADDYNANLPAPLNHIGTRSELLERIALFDSGFAMGQLESPQPIELPRTATRDDLSAALLKVKPDAPLWDRIQAEHYRGTVGKKIMPADKFQNLIAIRDAVRNHPTAAAILAHGVAEVSFVCDLSKMGENLPGRVAQCRADWYRDRLRIFADLKTCNDARPEAFGRDCYNFRYHVAAAWYSDVYKATTGRDLQAFYFIAVEKKAPYGLRVYRASEAMIEQGRIEYRADLGTLAKCLRSGEWPGYPIEIADLYLPKWAEKMVEEPAP